jgi:hypothetical protein
MNAPFLATAGCPMHGSVEEGGEQSCNGVAKSAPKSDSDFVCDVI